MEKNSEPARATVIIASPAAERAWTLLSLTKGERTNLPLFVFAAVVLTSPLKKSGCVSTLSST